MATTKKLMGTTAAAGEAFTAIEDVFSTYLYTGNGSTQTITNGIDLAGEGGLVWFKRRNSANPHQLFDTVRTSGYSLTTNNTDAQDDKTWLGFSVSSTGFSFGTTDADFNATSGTYASWTFRKAPRFFDVVTYTGDGVAGRAISHNLGIEPGFIVVKRLNAVEGWFCQHRSLGADKRMQLEQTYAATDEGNIPGTQTWYDTPTDSVFYVGSTNRNNGSGSTYVAYLFAHDPLGPSGDGSDGLIACGSYTGTGAAGNFQDLGWEPQYVLVKSASASGNWIIHDVMRGMSETTSYTLKAESSSSENLDTPGRLLPRPTGFEFSSSGLAANNASGDTYIYIAIRRGPMRQPTSGTEVFNPTLLYEFDKDGNTSSGNGIHGYLGAPTDGYIQLYRGGSSLNAIVLSRLTGANYLVTSSTAAEVSGSVNFWDNNVGSGFVTTNSVNTTISRLNFRRAPGFFDVVAYTGNGVAGRTVPHNLGVAPELMIVKSRSTTEGWFVYAEPLSATKVLELQRNIAAANEGSFAWNSAAPTNEVFTLGGTSGFTNTSGQTYIAYLFATLPGVSKVGSYTGNGGTGDINVDCGFTSGARFVLIKDATSANDWYVWDTARGIVAGNDPYLRLNSTGAETTDSDWVDPYSAGFTVTTGLYANLRINVFGNTYIFLAIA